MVPGGPAPTVNSSEVTLYLLKDGRPVRHVRVVTGPTSTGMALQELLAGPTDAERAQGLTSDVPVTTDPVTVRNGTILLPIDTNSLPTQAYTQLSCTATAAGLLVLNLKAFVTACQ